MWMDPLRAIPRVVVYDFKSLSLLIVQDTLHIIIDLPDMLDT